MGYPEKKEFKKFTYNDYKSWPDEERWEIIDGVAYSMSPSPSRLHQEILSVLFNEIYNYLKDKTCKVYPAPFDVRLPGANEGDEDIVNVVQPDIVIVCDKSKLDDKGCRGNPDFIIEIVSPSSSSIDYIKKFELYERYKVREYWIVHPIDKIVMVYKLVNEKYGRPDLYSSEDKIKVGIFENLTLDMKIVFPVD